MKHTFTSTIVLVLAAMATFAFDAGARAASIQSLNGEGWRIATDPKNEGREAKWFAAPRKEAQPTKVPWIIQDAFPGYHGVAWYWREFAAPANPHAGERRLLRFWAVDYLAEVWLNGIRVGGHEGGETPFVLDVTDAVRPGPGNRLAVRVLNPTTQPIDGIVLQQTPHRNKEIPYRAGASYNHGGIVDSVELWTVPALRVDNLFVQADPKTGKLHVQSTVHNAASLPARGSLELAAAAAPTGPTLCADRRQREFPPGDTRVDMDLSIQGPRLWDLNEPNLYRVTARVAADRSTSFDEHSVRCGFREFRFADGYFRLNGRRVFLRCSHTGNHTPIGLQLPHDPDLLRRDLLNVKVMGFNAIRFIAGLATRYQLDLCDEIGLLVYEESYAGWSLGDSPRMKQRFDRSTTEMIVRDRNHPSLVMWGLLNETVDGPVFQHAVTVLPLVRALDPGRMVLLNSGRWDERKERRGIGSLSNPGSAAWEDVLGDLHHYPRVPCTADEIRMLRTREGSGGQPLFLSEYGIGSAVDLRRTVRHYEQRGAERLEDAQFYRDKLTRFEADWAQWRLDEAFARPEDFFTASLAKMAGQRELGLNAIRANANVVGHSVSGTVDQGMTGEGLCTTFRELKPGTVDAMFEGFAPLRLCLFAEPVNVYRGARVRFEAVLANEDALAPGEYPVRLLVVGPQNQRVFEKTVNAAIAKDAPFAVPLFADDVVVDGPSGRYRFLASFQRGGAATGGETEFYLADPAEMPAVKTEVTLCGEDAALTKWLTDRGVRCRKLGAGEPTPREVLLVSKTPPAFEDLWARVQRGATAVFLSPEVLKKGGEPLGWLPLANKGTAKPIRGWLYLKDEWAKRHPIFDGLPCGGLMDYTFYREIIPDVVLVDQDPPAEAVAGAIKASQDYSSGLMVAVYKSGAGRFILNTLLIRQNLGTNPVAERLLRNLLNHAASQSK